MDKKMVYFIINDYTSYDINMKISMTVWTFLIMNIIALLILTTFWIETLL